MSINFEAQSPVEFENILENKLRILPNYLNLFKDKTSIRLELLNSEVEVNVYGQIETKHLAIG